MKSRNLLIIMLLCIPLLLPGSVYAQSIVKAEQPLTNATLQQCIDYALSNRPEVKQSILDEEIADRDIKSALAGWLPQINATGSLNHNLKQQSQVLTTNGVSSLLTFGAKNTSSLVLQADQQFLNAGLIQASKSAKYFRHRFADFRLATQPEEHRPFQVAGCPHGHQAR